MRILVCGGTGVIGHYLVPRLVARGHQVTVLARTSERAQLAEAQGARTAAGDLFDVESLHTAAAGQDALLNVATHMPHTFPGRPSDFAINDRIRREGTGNVLAAAQKAGVTRVVLQSMIWVHGDQDGAWIDETAPLRPGPLGRSAVELEEQGRAFAQRTGATTTILRLGGLYAAESWHTREIIDRLKKRLAPIIGHGDSYQDFIHAADAAEAYARAVDAKRSATYFVTDDEPVRLGDYLAWLARASGAPAPFHVPQFVARMTLGHEMAAAYTASLRCRNDRIKADLGWAPKYPTFRDGYGEVLPRL